MLLFYVCSCIFLFVFISYYEKHDYYSCTQTLYFILKVTKHTTKHDYIFLLSSNFENVGTKKGDVHKGSKITDFGPRPLLSALVRF